MKKLIVAAATVAMAVAVQAASINWVSSGYLWDSKTNAKATSISGGSIVLCLIDDGSDWTKGVTELDTGVLTTSGMTAAIGKVKGSNSGNYSFSYSSGVISNGDVLTVLFKDDKGKYSQLAYVDADGKPTKTLVTDTYTVSGLSGDDSVLAAFNFAGSGNFTSNVPEPTSGLLMLLGVAGLALRRKRA